jgi:UDP-glucose 4-epimerase
MNILLTGGSGFIGKNIIESFLSQKYTILAPTHKELELLDEDSVRDFFCRHNIDVVIHGAVRAGHRFAKDASNQLYNNTKMFFNIVRNSDKYKKMIFLGSGLTYDIRYYTPKMKEEYFDIHVPSDEGGFSKYIVAKYIEKADNIIELRIFGIFGKYEEYAIRFISNAICKVLFDLPVTIKQNRTFDYLYINDLMPVIDYFIQNNGKYKAYNVTPNESIELYTLAEKVIKISGKDLPLVVSQSGMGIEYSGDNSRLQEEVRDLKLVPPDEAIRELYEWYSDNRHLINKEYLLFDK